jgi:2,4-dienoyl-CoA reductase-like NADH-dependent reductase (Old Yellow Enzyme family)
MLIIDLPTVGLNNYGGFGMTENVLQDFVFNNGLRLRNRVVMSPMTTMASFYNGMVTQDEIDYYAARSSGPGMVITGVANVSASGKGFEGELSVSQDSMIPGLQEVANAIKKHGALAVLQIFHAGRKSNSRILRGEHPKSASAVAAEYPQDSEIPQELSDSEIREIIEDFAQATRRAIAAGFDGVELHGANTYLLQQFFSPHSNRRQDRWGGDCDKRMNFALAVISSVHKAISTYAARPFLLGYRLSPEEIETPGIRFQDSLYFAEQIREHIDYLHLSMGSYQRSSLNDTQDQEPLQAKFARVTKGHIPLIGVGSVESLEDAEAALAGGADLVALGRELLREPQWVQKISAHDFASIRTTISTSDMAELSIPPVMRTYLLTAFRSVMHVADDEIPATRGDISSADESHVQYRHQMAPMEGFEKKL